MSDTQKGNIMSNMNKVEITNMDVFFDYIKKHFFADITNQPYLLQHTPNSVLTPILDTLKSHLSDDAIKQIKNILFYKWIYTNGMKSLLLNPNSDYIIRNKTDYEFVPKQELYGHLLQIKDYFDYMTDFYIQKNMSYKLKLALFTSETFESAFNKANIEFEKRVKRNSALGIDNEKNILMHLDNGYKLVKLNTVYDLDYEGLCIGHCIGEGVLDKEINDKNSTITICSLRKDMLVKERLSKINMVRSIPFASIVIDHFEKLQNGKISGNVISIEGHIAGKVRYYLKNRLDKQDAWKGRFPPYIHPTSVSSEEIAYRDAELQRTLTNFFMQNKLIICGERKYTTCLTQEYTINMPTTYSVRVQTQDDLRKASQQGFYHIVIPSYDIFVPTTQPIRVEPFDNKHSINITKSGTYDCTEMQNLRTINVCASQVTIYCYNCNNLQNINRLTDTKVLIERNKCNIIQNTR